MNGAGAIPVVVTGAAGRMGRTLVRAVAADPATMLAGATERPGHPALGTDAALGAGSSNGGVQISGELEPLVTTRTVVIDFTAPAATLRHVETCARRGAPMVIGTTGLSAEERVVVADAARQIPIVLSPNMSVGVNLMFALAAEAARVLGDDYDVEIIETHHRLKKDSPSGTAAKLLEVVAAALGRDALADAVHGRNGLVGERTRREIGVHAVRAGDNVGEHHVLYGGIGEAIEIVHRATDRAVFAGGAVRAARWLWAQPAGLYDMADVLDLKR